jgi:hypothetical protein
MTEELEASSTRTGAHSGGSYAIASGWLALFGPRPGFIFSTQRREPDWQQWQEGGRYHGLARFGVGSDGLLNREPLQAIPREKPYRVSARQFGGRC